MPVTIQMIETKEFMVRPNGYDPQEVDTFLDDIVDEMDRMQREIKVLKQEASKLQSSGGRKDASPSSSQSSSADETIRNMIVSAQRVCDESITDAKKRSEDILTSAKKDAEHLLSAAREENKQLTAKLATLRDTVTDYKARFRKLLDEQLRVLGSD
ncbi:MAG: DivIVA domain-containing protein [Oscillospiraceae bacterium]|jgi:cell division initiation protein|nr:DivIVA domain-containing protein [Oscillospiraceae bacterium]